MQRDVERAIKEALTIAGQRGGVIAAVTLAAEDATADVLPLAYKLLQRHGIEEADVAVVEGDGPVRLVSVEIKR